MKAVEWFYSLPSTPPSGHLLDRAAEKAAPRRFTGESVTAFADLPPIPTAAEFIAQVDQASGTRWVGDELVRFAPELSDEEADAINAAEEREALERAERDEYLHDKRDAERQRYGYGSGE